MRTKNTNSSKYLDVVCVEYIQFRRIVNDFNLKIDYVDDRFMFCLLTLKSMSFLLKGVAFEKLVDKKYQK